MKRFQPIKQGIIKVTHYDYNIDNDYYYRYIDYRQVLNYMWFE